jgi:hypothetical protein
MKERMVLTGGLVLLFLVALNLLLLAQKGPPVFVAPAPAAAAVVLPAARWKSATRTRRCSI